MNALHRSGLILVAAAFPLLASAPAHAGGPIANCQDGVPYVWPDGGNGITWNADLGTLGPLSKEAADALVADSFQRWQDVASATISYQQGADLAVDVTVDNFEPFLDAPEPDGLSAIVYDDTGEIFELLYGPDSGVLGFAGPEWINPSECTILEGLAFLNGPEFSATDNRLGFGIMVHEFGHFSGLAHSQTNGGILLGIAVGVPEPSGPAPANTFGTPTVADFAAGDGLIETMYPFLFGPQFGVESPGRDDTTNISRLYPAAGYASSTATFNGSIFAPNGTTRLSGVNVIARNVANPFLDAVSAISGDYTEATDPAVSAVVGTYRFTGLTPGASYNVYVDGILDGGFSTTPRVLPGVEEFANSGAAETNGDAPGTPSAFSAAAGGTVNNVNVVFNVPHPGDPLGVGDDGFVELFTPFPIDFCGVRYTSVFVNANGNLTFGGNDEEFFEGTDLMLNGPPRIAGLWDDLNSTAGGVITFDQTSTTFTVKYQNVPEWATTGGTGSNTFSITFTKKNRLIDLLAGSLVGNQFSISYGAVSALDGIAGYTCGSALTSGFEQETDLSKVHGTIGELLPLPAVFEDFVGTSASETFDLKGTLKFAGVARIIDIIELLRRNNSIAKAFPLLSLPFDSADPQIATSIEPTGNDVDFYSLRLRAGEIIALQVVRGNLDSVLGVFNADTGELLAVDDDGGNFPLSRLILQANEDIKIAFAVSTYPDFDFTGAGETGGRYTLYVNTYRGEPIDIGDEDSVEVSLGNFKFDFQGARHSSMFVNSNGSISFAEGDPSFEHSLDNFLAGPPRIAPLWTDLDPTGSLGNTGLVVVNTSSSKSAKVHFISVSEFFSSDPNYFSIDLEKNGKFEMDWGPTSRTSCVGVLFEGLDNCNLTGVTEGGGADDPGPTDLSKANRLRSDGTTYQEFLIDATYKFASDIDLFFSSLDFK